MARTYNILLLDDLPEHRELIIRAFKEDSRSWKIIEASLIQEAKVNLAKGEIDLLIADWSLPDGESLQLMNEYPEGTRPFPVIVMTSYGDESVVVDVMKAGALDYCVKTEKSLMAMPRIAFRAIREWGHVLDKRDALLKLEESFANEKRLRKEAEELRQRAENANEAKNKFLAIMSHELRTPLFPIMGYVKMIRDKVEDKEVNEMLEIINNSANDLSSLIGDIMDIVELDSGSVEHKEEEVTTSEIRDELMKSFSAKALSKGVMLQIEDGGDTATKLICDRMLLYRAVYYVVDNAIKFTDKGDVTVEFSIEPEGDKGSLRVNVRDDGVGIPDDKKSMIFDIFSQADYTFTRSIGGAGLGLSLCKQIVDKLGGSINFESELDAGSHFVLNFPVRFKDEIAEAKSLSSKTDLSGETILLAEDDPTNRMLLEAYLNFYSSNLLLAEDGEIALELCREHKPALIVTDYHMPGLNGLELVHACRRLDPAGYRPEIVLFTADARRELVRECKDAGIRHVLEKPFGMSEIGEVLEGYGFGKLR